MHRYMQLLWDSYSTLSIACRLGKILCYLVSTRSCTDRNNTLQTRDRSTNVNYCSLEGRTSSTDPTASIARSFCSACCYLAKKKCCFNEKQASLRWMQVHKTIYCFYILQTAIALCARAKPQDHVWIRDVIITCTRVTMNESTDKQYSWETEYEKSWYSVLLIL